jgi:hypothetical protein
MSEAFKDDPVFRFLFSSMTDEERYVYLPTAMRSLLTACVLNGGVLQEAKFVIDKPVISSNPLTI